MKKYNITNILLHLILLAYFIYFNVVYIFPLFIKKTENFDNNNEVDHKKELEDLEDRIKNADNIEELKRSNELLNQYRLAFQKYQKNNIENSLSLDYDYIELKMDSCKNNVEKNIKLFEIEIENEKIKEENLKIKDDDRYKDIMLKVQENNDKDADRIKKMILEANNLNKNQNSNLNMETINQKRIALIKENQKQKKNENSNEILQENSDLIKKLGLTQIFKNKFGFKG